MDIPCGNSPNAIDIDNITCTAMLNVIYTRTRCYSTMSLLYPDASMTQLLPVTSGTNLSWSKYATSFHFLVTCHCKDSHKFGIPQFIRVLQIGHTLCGEQGDKWVVKRDSSSLQQTTCWTQTQDVIQCAPDISRLIFSKQLTKGTIARPWGRDMGVFREFEVWPKFYPRNCCAVCNNILWYTVIYREFIILSKCREMSTVLVSHFESCLLSEKHA